MVGVARPYAMYGPASERLVRVQAGGCNAINSPCRTASSVPFRRFRWSPIPWRTWVFRNLCQVPGDLLRSPS